MYDAKRVNTIIKQEVLDTLNDAKRYVGFYMYERGTCPYKLLGEFITKWEKESENI